MGRSLLAIALSATALFFAGCNAQPQPEVSAEEAFEALKAEFGEVETAEEKAVLAEDFLSKYPASDYTAILADAVIHYRGTELGQKQEAWDTLNAALEKVEDPEIRFATKMSLLDLSHELGQPIDVAAEAEFLGQHRPLDFGEHLDIMEAGVEHEEWALVETHAKKSLEHATAQAFLDDYPDSDYSLEYAQTKADRRKALAMTNQAWAMANTDRQDEALELFAQAASFGGTNYLGVPDTDVNLYWGKTLLASEEADKALELLAPVAIMGDSEEAMDALRQAWAATNGRDEDFDEYLASTREELARPVDSFVLANYDGEDVDFANFKEKVTLLAFWFPT